MRSSPDHSALTAGLHTLVEMLRGGRTGLPALTQLLGAAGDALGAAGASLSEHDGTGWRVVAATGAASWAVGLPVPGAGPLPGPASWEEPLESATGELATQLRGRGLRWSLATSVSRPSGGDAVLCVYFWQDGPGGPEHHAVLRFVGSCAAALYAESERLPSADPAPALAHRDLFLAVTSHELRTPITAIKGFADTLEQHWDTLDAEARLEAVRVIRQRASELAALVDRLLETAVDGAGPEHHRPFDLATALHRAVAKLPDRLRRRLRRDLPGGLPAAYGNPDGVTPVLAELVNNAAKHSTGEVLLEASADAQTVVFRVCDSGVGIAPEHVERAFTRYWQADSGDTRETDGAGLGLHLVRRIVEQQRGWVSLRPRQSGGTVAEVRLLRADVAGPDES